MSGTANVPNVLANLPGSPATNPISLADDNWDYLETYINNREITLDVLSNRPVAGTSGRYYFATDDNGGTLYVDTGSAWVQIAFPVGTTNFLALFYALPLWCPQL